MRRIVLVFGLIAGALLSVMMLATMPFMDRIGFDKGLLVGYTSMVLAFLCIFFGIRSYRENVGNGAISFPRALSIGVLITVVASLCYVATWQLIYFKLTPDFMDKYAAYVLQTDREKGATDAAILKRQQELQEFKQKYQNPIFNAAVTIMEPLPVGLVMALVSAGILRRKARREQTTAERTPVMM
jgi:hypothetical protein